MNDFFRSHQKVSVAILAVLLIISGLTVYVAFFNWNSLRPALARRITAATGRPAAIDGDLKVHLWSWNPRAEINGLELRNPSWTDRPVMFAAKRITVSISISHLLRGHIVMPEVTLSEPEINLERDAQGRASWELGTQAGTPNHDTRPAKVPTVQRLIIAGGKLHVVDQIRKLTFSGSLIAAEQAGNADPSALKIRCSGTLNAKPFRLEADGGPLMDLEPTKPYSFTAHIIASDINLDTHVTVRKPFDLGALDVKFAVTGNDLADIFYLTGLALPNTPKYRLAATVHVDGTQMTFDGLNGHLGTSDLTGQGRVDIGGTVPKLTANLSSVTLNMVDLEPTLGKPAQPKTSSLSTHGGGASSSAPRAPPQDAARADGGLLLPDADLQVQRVRGMDAEVTYQAGSVTMPKVPMKQVAFHLVLAHGLLTIDPLSFFLDRGRFAGRVQIDARRDVPVSDIDMHIHDIDLSQFKSATMKQAPLEGALIGRFKFHGSGTSIHKMAASSDGAISVIIPDGQINDAIAELTGINVLRGLGLLLAKDQNKADIRCGILDFKDQQGKLRTTTMYVDTTNVLITGRGDIDLDSEVLNLALQGDPKKLRFLRLRSPVTVHGSLLHPAVGVRADKLVEQAGVAAALGTLLTPIAAAIAFIDPGLAKNKDCSTVLAQANAGVQN